MGRAPRRIFDLSQPIRGGMPVYPGDPEPSLRPVPGQAFSIEALHLGTHTGTHVDAPSHLFPDAVDVTGLPLERLAAPGVVLDLRAAHGTIDADALRHAAVVLGEGALAGHAVLLWTGWSARWTAPEYVDQHPGLDGSGAEWLVERGVALVGIDAMSIDVPGTSTFPGHRALLRSGVPIVENLTGLEAVYGRAFTFCALPLAIPGASGSPVRAVAVADQRGDQADRIDRIFGCVRSLTGGRLGVYSDIEGDERRCRDAEGQRDVLQVAVSLP